MDFPIFAPIPTAATAATSVVATVAAVAAAPAVASPERLPVISAGTCAKAVVIPVPIALAIPLTVAVSAPTAVAILPIIFPANGLT